MRGMKPGLSQQTLGFGRAITGREVKHRAKGTASVTGLFCLT